MTNLKTNSISIKLLENTHIFFFNNSIILKGPRGTISYSGFKDNEKYNITLHKQTIELSFNSQKIKNNNKLLQLSELVKNLMFGVHFFFSKKLLFIGIGLRSWGKTFKNGQKLLLLKAGFSQDLAIQIPKSIFVFSLRPTLLLIRGLNKQKVNQFASFIRLHKKPELYKGIGIQYQNENLVLKPGKEK